MWLMVLDLDPRRRTVNRKSPIQTDIAKSLPRIFGASAVPETRKFPLIPLNDLAELHRGGRLRGRRYDREIIIP